MSLYTPPSLPRTPAAYAMNATLPSRLPELLSSWSRQAPLTPPMTSTFQSRRTLSQPQPKVQMTLPPIAVLERHCAPLTPPDDVAPSPPPARLPPIYDHLLDRVMQQYRQPKPFDASDALCTDWLDASRTRSAPRIAEKTCEMICYLWFSTLSPERKYPTPNNSPAYSSRPNPSTTTLQLVATPTFVQFMQKLLETTQVSQSVIVLSLHYIYRLKERNRFTPAQPGSEFRIAVAGLMMANKFLDDNTYTNKTWSEVSGIDLVEINRMEKEFLMGVDFNLYVDKPTYESWLNLLKGLVLAKERDSLHFRKSRWAARASKSHPNSSSGPATRTHTSRSRQLPHRARSTSPSKSLPLSRGPSVIAQLYSPTPRSGTKRSATAAFSPTSAGFSQLPSKRPVSICLQIPEFIPGNNGAPHSCSPLESLQSFATMSLASPARAAPQSGDLNSNWSSGVSRAPETLVTPYPLNEERRTAVPQHLYFYTLACSPMSSPVEEDLPSRKARLRYQPPPLSSAAPYCRPQLPEPMIQSASTSPHERYMHVMPQTLPHFYDVDWVQLSQVPSSYTQPQRTTGYTTQPRPMSTEKIVPLAPFANAGPPGVHFYPTPVQNSLAYPANWPRARRV